MQDRAGSVFVVATANDVSKLPPELLRKGRFDEVFFVDLPNRAERAQVIAAALADNGRAGADIDLAAIAEVTSDFTGAELAALIPDAMFSAFADAERPITTGDVIAAAKATVPLARTASERIAALRQWAIGRARMASAPETVSPNAAQRRTLDL
jgi:SpoVK/Ycf46/Vps4 family AAA+-type ATPase